MESDKSHSYLSLADAQASGKIDEFIVQEEQRGIGSVSLADLDRALSRLIKAEKREDQTSRSASSDGSTGKRTR